MDNTYVRDAARESLSSFMADVVDLIHWTPDISAFSMTTKVGYYFPGLVDFLQECPLEDVSCISAEVNVERFLFHLEQLKVCVFIYMYIKNNLLM